VHNVLFALEFVNIVGCGLYGKGLADCHLLEVDLPEAGGCVVIALEDDFVALHDAKMLVSLS
jgi:hypothetical protein